MKLKLNLNPIYTSKKIGTARQIFGTVLKILGVPKLPPGGSLGTGKRGTVPKIWRAVPISLARVNGVRSLGVRPVNLKRERKFLQ